MESNRGTAGEPVLDTEGRDHGQVGLGGSRQRVAAALRLAIFREQALHGLDDPLAQPVAELPWRAVRTGCVGDTGEGPQVYARWSEQQALLLEDGIDARLQFERITLSDAEEHLARR